MPAARQYVADPTLCEVPYGPRQIARYSDLDRWELFYVVPGRARRRAGVAMTSDVRAKQTPGSFEEQRLTKILAEYPRG
jgi:hypothetical protein